MIKVVDDETHTLVDLQSRQAFLKVERDSRYKGSEHSFLSVPYVEGGRLE